MRLKTNTSTKQVLESLKRENVVQYIIDANAGLGFPKIHKPCFLLLGHANNLILKVWLPSETGYSDLVGPNFTLDIKS